MMTGSGHFLAKIFMLTILLFGLCSGEDIVLKPTTSGQKEAALVVIQGPGVDPKQYVPLAKAIQDSIKPNVSLWVGIPQYNANTPSAVDMGKGVTRVLSAMENAGMHPTASQFIAAHSLSGIEAQAYVMKNPKSFIGQVLLGSFLQRTYRNETYPVKTFTISGELDGVCRVSRVMEEYWHRITSASDFNEAVRTYPVVVVPGMSHVQFLGSPDDPPVIVKEMDLKPEITFDEAHQAVSSSVSAFMQGCLGNESALNYLVDVVQLTGAFLQPIIAAYQIAGSYHFKPPCYEYPPSSACTVSCQWTEKAVVMMGNLTSSLGTVSAMDAFHPAAEIFPHVHHPHVTGTCSSPSETCIVNVTSVSENIYSELDRLDTGLDYTSASEIRGKMKSRQSIMEGTGMGPVDFNVTDVPDLCRIINQQSYLWSLARAGQKTLQRYKQFGVQMMMGSTEGPYNNGGIWIYKPMSYTTVKNSTGGDVLEVRSLVLKTDVHFILKGFAGMHFCKLLSPARVMEWVYVDSLRTYYSF
jgi:hypothetical protein